MDGPIGPHIIISRDLLRHSDDIASIATRFAVAAVDAVDAVAAGDYWL